MDASLEKQVRRAMPKFGKERGAAQALLQLRGTRRLLSAFGGGMAFVVDCRGILKLDYFLADVAVDVGCVRAAMEAAVFSTKSAVSAVFTLSSIRKHAVVFSGCRMLVCAQAKVQFLPCFSFRILVFFLSVVVSGQMSCTKCYIHLPSSQRAKCLRWRCFSRR